MNKFSFRHFSRLSLWVIFSLTAYHAAAQKNPLADALRKGDLATYKKLVSTAQLDSPNASGSAPLHFAAQYGQDSALADLLKRGANPLVRDVDGNTPLHLAAQNGHAFAVDRLISQKAGLNSRNLEGNTPLHVAILSMQSDALAKLLAAGADVDAQNELGQSPLHMAALIGDTSVVSMLITHGANPMLKSIDGQSLMHFAARGGNPEMVNIAKRLNVSQTDLDIRGRSPLSFAIQTGELPLWKALDNPAGLDIPDKDGLTPLFYAAYRGDTGAVSFLLRAGASPMAKNNQHLTADMAARAANAPLAAKQIKDAIEAQKIIDAENLKAAENVLPLSSTVKLPDDENPKGKKTKKRKKKK